jgi:hypothetical protein
MKLSILISSVATGVCARPQYETANPHEWMAPGPNDCKFTELQT